jgi:hypothetical protein
MFYNISYDLCCYWCHAKAILSQFSHTNKASSTTDENADDDEILHGLDDTEGEEGGEPAVDEEDGDEVDPLVEASDAAMIEEVAAKVNADSPLPPLTRAEINLGHFSLSKVGVSFL